MVFFIFKQNTAYEMRISDWSSDVCSSDLAAFYAGSLRNCIPAEAGVALMSISVIRAAFECDGCGKPFKVDIEPSTKNWMRRQDMLSIAENAIRGGMTSDGEFCSIQADMHLCGDCTAVADALRPDEDELQPHTAKLKHKSGAS